jgi:hypothetical protein
MRGSCFYEGVVDADIGFCFVAYEEVDWSHGCLEYELGSGRVCDASQRAPCIREYHCEQSTWSF